MTSSMSRQVICCASPRVLLVSVLLDPSADTSLRRSKWSRYRNYVRGSSEESSVENGQRTDSRIGTRSEQTRGAARGGNSSGPKSRSCHSAVYDSKRPLAQLIET